MATLLPSPRPRSSVTTIREIVRSAPETCPRSRLILRQSGAELETAELFAGMNPAHSSNVGEIVTELATNRLNYEEQASNHYAELESASLQICTPESAWASLTPPAQRHRTAHGMPRRLACLRRI